jgi:putative sigma-54 modulation protein
MALDKLDKQIKKNKKKYKKSRSTAARRKTFPYQQTGAASGDVEHESMPRVMKIKNIEYKPMDVDEAVLQMRLIKDSFLVFTDAQTQQIHVLYRLKDGNFGLIQPRL